MENEDLEAQYLFTIAGEIVKPGRWKMDVLHRSVFTAICNILWEECMNNAINYEKQFAHESGYAFKEKTAYWQHASQYLKHMVHRFAGSFNSESLAIYYFNNLIHLTKKENGTRSEHIPASGAESNLLAEQGGQSSQCDNPNDKSSS